MIRSSEGLHLKGKVKSAATRGPGVSWLGSAPQARVFIGFQYPTPPLQFTRPADQLAANVIPIQLDGLRKKERLRELYRQAAPAAAVADLAATIGPMAGLDHDAALCLLTEFAAESGYARKFLSVLFRVSVVSVLARPLSPRLQGRSFGARGPVANPREDMGKRLRPPQSEVERAAGR